MLQPTREELLGTQRATVMLCACMVEAMQDWRSSFQRSVCGGLGSRISNSKRCACEHSGVEDAVVGTRNVTGFSVVAGQGKPFFDE